MPSSGYGSVDLTGADPENAGTALITRAKRAMDCGMFIEWLESFVAAWNQTHDPFEASMAGIIEWDM